MHSIRLASGRVLHVTLSQKQEEHKTFESHSLAEKMETGVGVGVRAGGISSQGKPRSQWVWPAAAHLEPKRQGVDLEKKKRKKAATSEHEQEDHIQKPTV